MRYTLLTSIVSILLLACCGASANPDGTLQSNPGDVSEKAWYTVFPTPDTDYTTTGSFILATLGDGLLDHSTDARNHSVVNSWTVEADSDQITTLVNHPGIQRVQKIGAVEKRDDQAPVPSIVHPKRDLNQAQRDDIASFLRQMTAKEVWGYHRRDKSFLCWTVDMTAGQRVRASLYPGVDYTKLEPQIEWHGVVSRSPDMPNQVADVTPMAINGSQPNEQLAEAIEYEYQQRAPVDLVAVSQPKEFRDISRLTDYVYEKNPGSKSFIYHVEHGVPFSLLPDEFPHVAPNHIVTPRASQRGLSPDPPKELVSEHSVCTASKALGQKYGVAKGATLIVVLLGGYGLLEYVEAMEDILDDLEAHPERQKHSVVTSSVGIVPDGSEDEEILRDVMADIMELDVPIVQSSGNQGDQPSRKQPDQVPGIWADTADFPLIVVGSVDAQGNISPWSQEGDKVVTHGVGEHTKCYWGLTDDGPDHKGTSFSAPLVAGQIAVWLSSDTIPAGIDTTTGKLAASMLEYVRGRNKNSDGSRIIDDEAGWCRQPGVRMIYNGVPFTEYPLDDAPFYKWCWPFMKRDTLADHKYVEREILQKIIQEEFCPDFVDHGSISRRYRENTMADVVMSIDYDSDTPRTQDFCMRYFLGELVDGCYNPIDNPANYKSGGKATLGPVTFKIEPQAFRQDPAKGVDGGCSSSYKVAFNDYTVWGHGFASDDFGERLKHELGGCALFGGTWKFEYGLGDDGREWTAWFRTGVFQKHCVGDAFHTAGGPADKWCSGTGKE